MILRYTKMTLVSFCCFLSVVMLTAVSSALEDHNDLMLLVQSNKQTYKLGEIIDIRISLKNVSSDTISLYHQGLRDGVWHDLDLNVTVTTPDSQKILIKHAIYNSLLPTPKEEHFRTLEPDGDLVIPMKFVHFSRDNHSKRNLWSAFIRISEQEFNNAPSDYLRNRYGIRGEIYYVSGKYHYLALKEVLLDVFNIEGRYVLDFEYTNGRNQYAAPDEDNKYMIGVEVPLAWTGTLTETIEIEIEE